MIKEDIKRIKGEPMQNVLRITENLDGMDFFL